VVAPTPQQLALLTRRERFAFRFCDLINRDGGWLKRASHWFLRHVGVAWVDFCTRHLVVPDGLETMRALRPPRGLLIVANHRSFFDMYLISLVLLKHTELLQRIYFPVRTEFFYQTLSGLFVNGIMSAWSMYPPVLRQPERNEFNKYTMARVNELLEQPGNVIGFHPEGTRNKTDDPYTLLPAQPGVGQIIMAARPTVLPIFLLGMGNRVGRQIKSNFDRTGRKIIIVFGAPMDLERYYAEPARLRTYMEVAKHVRAVLMELGQRERALRAQLEGTPPPDAKPDGSDQAA